VDCGCLSAPYYTVYGQKNVWPSVSGCLEVVLASDDVITRNSRWRLKTGSSYFRTLNGANRLRPLLVCCTQNLESLSPPIFEQDPIKVCKNVRKCLYSVTFVVNMHTLAGEVVGEGGRLRAPVFRAAVYCGRHGVHLAIALLQLRAL
jgi:hypothetical protein